MKQGFAGKKILAHPLQSFRYGVMVVRADEGSRRGAANEMKNDHSTGGVATIGDNIQIQSNKKQQMKKRILLKHIF